MTTLPKNMPEIVHPELRARCERYRQLMERNIPILFPQGVDVALDSTEPVAELLASDDYVAQCREANEANADLYRVHQWKPNVLAAGVLPNGTLLVDALCESWLRHLHGYRLHDWQEHLAQLRYAVVSQAADFVPGKLEKGVYERLSYTAWLNVFVFPSAIRKLRREHDRNSRTLSLDQSENEGDDIPEPFYEPRLAQQADESQVRVILSEAIRHFAWTRRTRAWFLHICASGNTMRTVSRRSGVECSTISRALRPLRKDIFQRLRRAFPGSEKFSPRQFGDFYVLIQRFFSEAELNELIR